MEIIGSGAEAIIVKAQDCVIKKRIAKSYRITQIDDKLRKSRTKREFNIIIKLLENKLNVPKVRQIDKYDLELEYINGTKVRDCFEESVELISKEIGKFVAKIHNLNITHGDLTTSNMILLKSKVYFIDFGLSQVTHRIEDKAVDLHLLFQALESYHYKHFEEASKLILKEYSKNSIEAESILKRLEVVQKRGRNKH